MKNRTTGQKHPIPAKETALFCGQVALLLKAGIPLKEGVRSLGEEADTAIIGQLADAVEETGSLYEALRTVGVFPSYMVQMVRVGETVGRLENVMESLSRYYERESALRSSARSAVLYPVALILLMAAVVAVLVTQVLPVFAKVFEQLGAEASQTTLSVMRFGSVTGWCVLGVVALLLLLLLLVLLLCRTAGGMRYLLRLCRRLPLLSGLCRKLASGRFASVMAMMLSSGYDLDGALELAPGVTGDEDLAEKLTACREQLAQGHSLSDALLHLGLFSGLYARMIQVGVQTGQLDTVMEHLATLYEQETDEAFGRLIALIEPTLVVLLSLIIGAILLSVMLPLISALIIIG